MKKALFSTVCLAFALPSAALAQESAAAQQPEASEALEDVIVTAERRSTTVQTTPLAISAIGGDAMRESNITNVEELTRVIPNVIFSTVGANVNFNIRGLGTTGVAPGAESRVAIYSDGVYMNRNQAAFMGFYDVDRVELLRGPQGTLYGRNSVAGAMNIISNRPGDELNGYLTGEVGDFELFSAEGAVGGPISDGVGGRLAFRAVDRGGYGEMIETGEDVNDESSHSMRGTLSFQPTSTLSLDLIADYSNRRDHSGGFRDAGRGDNATPSEVEIFGLTVPSDPQDAAGIQPLSDLETWGISAEANLDVTESTRITLVTGYRNFEYSQRTSIDGTSEAVSPNFVTDNSETTTVELRVSHDFGDVANLIVGGYFFDDVSEATNQAPFDGTIIGGTPGVLYEGYGAAGTVETQAYALFTQLHVELTEKWGLDVGLRYSHEEKNLEELFQFDLATAPFVLNNPLAGFGQSLAETWNSLDPRVTLSYQATDDAYLYATYSTGFKSGGYNVGGLQSAFDPELVTDYEAGIKVYLFDRRARINLAIFRYEYEDMQLNVVDGLSLVTRNASAATVDGIEAEMNFLPTRDLELSLNVAYLDGQFEDFFDTDQAHAGLGLQDLSGNQLPNAPRWQVGGVLSYTFHTSFGDLTPRVNATWYDTIYFNHYNTVEASQDAYSLVDLSLGWQSPNGDWRASAYVQNATDETYFSGVNVNSVFHQYQRTAIYGAPRTVGVNLTRSF